MLIISDIHDKLRLKLVNPKFKFWFEENKERVNKVKKGKKNVGDECLSKDDLSILRSLLAQN